MLEDGNAGLNGQQGMSVAQLNDLTAKPAVVEHGDLVMVSTEVLHEGVVQAMLLLLKLLLHNGFEVWEMPESWVFPWDFAHIFRKRGSHEIEPERSERGRAAGISTHPLPSLNPLRDKGIRLGRNTQSSTATPRYKPLESIDHHTGGRSWVQHTPYTTTTQGGYSLWGSVVQYSYQKVLCLRTPNRWGV